MAEVDIDEVANLGVDICLYLLVEVECRHAALRGVALRVIAEIVDNLECQLGATAAIDAKQGLAVEEIQFLAYLVEARDFVQQAAAGIVQHRPFALLGPVLLHQLVHLPVLVLLKRHVLAAEDNIPNLRNFHIIFRLGIVLHRRGHRRRLVAGAHGGISNTVALPPHRSVNRQQKQQC